MLDLEILAWKSSKSIEILDLETIRNLIKGQKAFTAVLYQNEHLFKIMVIGPKIGNLLGFQNHL